MPRAEIEGDMGDSHVGLQARLMSQALRKLTGAIRRTRLIFINQIREKIGMVFGNPETTPGGRALKFYASVRMDIRRIESIKDGRKSSAPASEGREEQGCAAVPQAEFDIMYGEGSQNGEVLDIGSRTNRRQSGAWFAYGTTVSARAARTPRTSSRATRRWREPSRSVSGKSSASFGRLRLRRSSQLSQLLRRGRPSCFAAGWPPFLMYGGTRERGSVR